MKKGSVTLVGLLITLAIIIFVIAKIVSSQLQSAQSLNQSANPTKIQNQVNTYQKQLQEKQDQNLTTDIK